MDRLAESRYISVADYRHLRVPGGHHQDGDSWLFLPQAAGGSWDLHDGAEPRQLQWHLQTHNTSVLSLAEVSLTRGQIGKGLQLQIEDQVFPAVAHEVDQQAQCIRVCLVLASKAVAVLTLPLSAPSALGNSTSILDRFGQGVSSDAGWRVVQLDQQLSGLGLPSALAAADGHLCITSTSGLTVCISTVLLAAQDPEQVLLEGQGLVFSLDPSGLVAQVKRKIGWAASPPSVAAVAVHVPRAKHSSLLVVHEDGSCRQWLVGQHRQGWVQQLTTGNQGRPARPSKVCVCYPQPTPGARAPSWDVLLVFDAGQPDRGAQSDIRVLPLRLQREQDQAAAASKLEPLLQQPQQLQLEWPDATLLDAQMSGQQLLLLCRTGSSGNVVVSYAARDWRYQGPCQLLQQKNTDWGGHQEVWSAALAAFPDDIDPGSHVLSQMLVPGQLCGLSLRQTLAYFGGQLGETELAECSLSHLQACITAAVQLIQSRNPSYSLARCWHVLFSKYCEVWQQQHPLLGLWAAGNGWVGAVRSAGLLTVLRPMTPSEALSQESRPAALKQIMEAAGMTDSSSNSGVIGGPADVAKVRVCMDSLGEVLGQPALRVMTQLVMAGVPVESRLLPAFVQLLLQGPPLQQQQQKKQQPAGKTGFSSGGLAAAGQQQLLQWRQQRQTRLLTVHMQLGELPHALETLTGVVDLTILAATHSAAQLQQPGPAAAAAPPLATSSLLSSLALHSLRATCTTLQKLLLLLGYISHLGSLGSAPVTAADQAAMATDLITPVATALRSAAAALWLCKTPASSPVPGLMAGLKGTTGLPGPLPSLRTVAEAAEAGAAPGVEAASQAAAGAPSGSVGALTSWRYPLAAHLLPSFWQQQHLAAGGPGGKGLSSCVNQLAVWLMLGAETAEASDAAVTHVISPEAWHRITGRARGPGQGIGPAVYAKAELALRSSQGLAGRAVLMGYRLFAAREYAAMQRLVRLVGGQSPSEAGLQYILGLSTACSSSATAAGPQLDAAVGHLFRAAAGLSSSEAGPLRVVLQLLRREQHQQQPGEDLRLADPLPAADMQPEPELLEPNGVHHDHHHHQQQQQQQQQQAVLRLQFDRAVMMLFDQKGVKEGALAFARAALGVVDMAYGPGQQEAKQAQQAHLWSSIFNIALDLGLVEDAYTAALANPQAELAEEQIKRLVLELVEQGQLQQLLSLPWAGALQLRRERLLEPVPVVEVVIERLVSSACFSNHRSPTTQVLPAYQVLYDFLLAWGNYKHAAAAMLSCARRLRSIAAAAAEAGSVDKQQLGGTIDSVRAAYDACTSLLQLLEPTDAWIDPTQRLLQQYQAPLVTVGATRRPAGAITDGAASPFMPPARQQTASSSRQQRDAQQDAHRALQQQQQRKQGSAQRQQDLPAVLTLQQLQQEEAVFVAAAALHYKGSGLEVTALMRHGLDVGWLYDQLVGQGLFSEALQLAHAVYEGQQLLQQLEAAVAEIAGQCADLQHGSGQQQLSDDLQGVADDGVFGGGAGGSRAVLCSSQLTPVGPGYLCSEAAASWTKLRLLLESYDTFDCLSAGSGVSTAAAAAGASASGHASKAVNGTQPGSSSSSSGVSAGITLVGARLRLSAIDGLLSAQPRMSLPTWLLQPFQPAADAAGMSGAAADPAALLHKLMEHWRLVDAAELVGSYLDAWQQRSSLQRVHSTAVWLPLQDMELLHASLQDGARRAQEKSGVAEAEVLRRSAERLQQQLKQHLDLVGHDWGQLQQAAR